MATDLLCYSRMWRFNTTIWCDPDPVPFIFLLVSVPSDHFPRGFHTELCASCILHLSSMKGPLGPADFTVYTTGVLFLRIYCHIISYHVSCFYRNCMKNAVCIVEHLHFTLFSIMSKFILSLFWRCFVLV